MEQPAIYNDAQRSMIARRCRALGEPARLRILFLLQEHALSVGELARAVETSTANVSRHVDVLENCGLVDCVRSGGYVVCRAAHPDLRALWDVLLRTNAVEAPVSHTNDCELIEFALHIGSTMLHSGEWNRELWDRRMVRGSFTFTNRVALRASAPHPESGPRLD